MISITSFMHFFPFLVIELSFLPLHHASYYEIFHLIHFSRNSTLHFYRVRTHPITNFVHFIPFFVIEVSRLPLLHTSYYEKSALIPFSRNRKRRAHVQPSRPAQSSQAQKVLQNRPSLRRHNRFRVKLHAIHRQRFMLQRHNLILRRFCRNLQALWQAFRLHNQ